MSTCIPLVRGKLLWTADGQPGDELGTGLEAAGDTNNDGIPDVVASGPAGAGVAYIYSGADGAILQRFTSRDPAEAFGSHVAGIGDVDGDGFADVIVGAPGKDGERKTPGRAYIFSGKNGSLLRTLLGERTGDNFGSAVTGYSGARQHFVVVGAPAAGPSHHGRVYVFDSRSGSLKFRVDSDRSGSALGAMFLSVPGDLDGDGVPEIYSSDWSNTAKGLSTGRIYVHSGRTGRLLFSLTSGRRRARDLEPALRAPGMWTAMAARI